MAIYPKNDHRERLYSIGKVNGELLLSVKLHPHGLGSAFLHAQEKGASFKAKLLKNQHFRFPKKAAQIIMISNGTGIAPFLGMIDENTKKTSITLFAGFRTKASFALYEPLLNTLKEKCKLEHIYLSLSREEPKEYVSHRVLKNRKLIWAALQTGAVIMICGSLSMHRDVMKALDEICIGNNTSSQQFLQQGQILSDCY